jgi:hypothetical protein
MPLPFKPRRRVSLGRLFVVACIFAIITYYYAYRSPNIQLSSSNPRDAAGNSTLGVRIPVSSCKMTRKAVAFLPLLIRLFIVSEDLSTLERP